MELSLNKKYDQKIGEIIELTTFYFKLIRGENDITGHKPDVSKPDKPNEERECYVSP